MHYNAARNHFHKQQVYQRGAYSHFIDHLLLWFLFCFVIFCMLASLKTYDLREREGKYIWESVGGFRFKKNKQKKTTGPEFSLLRL